MAYSFRRSLRQRETTAASERPSSRLSACICLLLATVTAACGVTDRSPRELRAKPNIAIFIIDTLRADALGCYGSEVPDTSPELDALAARSVRFANVVAPCSWTRPSVAAMLTGLYPRRLGIYYQPRGILGDSRRTLAEMLREHGYTSFGITANPHMNSTFNLHQGFDEYVDSNAVFKFMRKDASRAYYRETTLPSATEMFERILEFDRRQAQGPKLVQINLMEVHEWQRRDQDLVRAEYDRLFADVPYAAYYRAVRQVSHDLGRFVEELASRPGWEDGLFVFVSDHGDGLGGHPNVPKTTTHGRVLYATNLLVPFFMVREGWEYAGRVVEQPVRLIDFAPTVLEAAGLPVPQALDGLSLMPLVRDPEAEIGLPEYFVAELGFPRKHKAAVYGQGWRYYENYDGHEGMARRELQVEGGRENGWRSSVIESIPSQAQEMARFFAIWSSSTQPAAEVPFRKAISSEEVEQLKALGYLQQSPPPASFPP